MSSEVALVHQGSLEIIPSLSFFIEKVDLQSSRVHQINPEILIMPYKEENDGTQKCYHKFTDNVSVTYYRGRPDSFYLSNLVYEKFVNAFKEFDEIGHNAYYQIRFKAEIEYSQIGINEEEMKLTRSLDLSCEGSFNGRSRDKLLCKPSQSTSLLLESLDVIEPEEFKPKSDMFSFQQVHH